MSSKGKLESTVSREELFLSFPIPTGGEALQYVVSIPWFFRLESSYHPLTGSALRRDYSDSFSHFPIVIDLAVQATEKSLLSHLPHSFERSRSLFLAR
jgi:hypothetical protein